MEAKKQHHIEVTIWFHPLLCLISILMLLDGRCNEIFRTKCKFLSNILLQIYLIKNNSRFNLAEAVGTMNRWVLIPILVPSCLPAPVVWVWMWFYCLSLFLTSSLKVRRSENKLIRKVENISFTLPNLPFECFIFCFIFRWRPFIRLSEGFQKDLLPIRKIGLERSMIRQRVRYYSIERVHRFCSSRTIYSLVL